MSRQLEVRNLVVNYGEIVGVRDLSMSVAKGEIVALLGSNGGKKYNAQGHHRHGEGNERLDHRRCQEVTGQPAHTTARKVSR